MNYPWSGKIHPQPHGICLWCGNKVSPTAAFQYSCGKCDTRKEPLPYLKKIMEQSSEHEARKYCQSEGLNYEREIRIGKLTEQIEKIANEARDEGEFTLSNILFSVSETLTYGKEGDLLKLINRFDRDVLAGPRGYHTYHA